MDSLLDTDSNHQFASGRRMTALSGCYASSDAAPPSSIGAGDRSVELAEDEVRMLSALADTLLARLKRSYETHAFAHHLRVDKKRWKAIKKREQLTVYKQKTAEPTEDDDDDQTAAADTAAALAESTASEDDEGMLLSASQAPAATPASGGGGFASRLRSKTRAKIDSISNNNSSNNSNNAQAKAPQLMVTGCVPGRVQDALYGLSSATSLAMKFRSSYCQDAVVDAQVLTTIEGPSVDEPFRFLGLKWVLQNHQTSSSTPSTAHFFKKRDVVFLESTGTTTLSSGEVVGFHIVHSVHLNSRARMVSINSHSSSSSVVRAKTSMGHLFRQRGASSGDSVDVFMRGYYDPSGGMLHFLAVNLAAEMLLHSATSFFECAQLKKLSWAAHRNTRQRRATAVFRATQTSMRGTNGAGGNMLQEMAAAAQEVDAEEEEAQNGSQNSSSSVCKICARRYGKLLQRGGAACTICAQMVCSRCTVVKRLSFTRNDGDSAAQQLAEDLERSGISLNSSQYGGGGATGSVKSSSSLRSSTQSRVQKEICQKNMNFCTACILSTSKQSASHVAVEEMLEHQAALATSLNFNSSMHFGSSRGTSVATPRQVLALAAANLQNQQQQQQRRRTTRAGSAQYFSTTPRVTYNNNNISSSSSSAATTPAARTPIASLVSHRETSSSKTPRPKAFSTSSTSSSTTSSVILYEEPTISSAVGA